MSFFQDPPQTPDLFIHDAALHAELGRRLPAEVNDALRPRLAELGRLTAERMPALAAQAEREQPELIHFDPWGRRVDEIRVSTAWEAMHAIAAEHGVVATAYEKDFGPYARLAQAAVLYLYSSSSATYSCPLAMTDAATRVLIDQAQPSLRERLVPGLTSRMPEQMLTSGQWMTERTGGSDVGGTETVARFLHNDGAEPRYRLYGVKWFSSATTADMALTLARVEEDGQTVSGSRGLSLFCVELKRGEHGGIDGIEVRRLKDKLGTKALPTAELTLDGVPATRIGAVGRGVANISTMLNVTRYYNAVASASGMARGLAMARDYAQRRTAFGRRIIEHPLHARTLDELEATTAGALAMCCEVASLLGKLEQQSIGEEEQRFLRGLIPLAKLTTGKQAVAVASETLECFGGAGYVEDTGLPRLLRDAQVLPIWEGTTNILSLDLLRAEGKERAFSAVIDTLARRTEALEGQLPAKAHSVLAGVLGRLARVLPALAVADDDHTRLEREARRLALTCGHAAQAVLLGETAVAVQSQQPEATGRFERFCFSQLAPPLEDLI